ncbi:MAG TPA: sigma-70 family RNA polymerase sigma factor [Burkholderiaceae bacterium]|jgi:RNA polymerase sigma-70 factor (ECF subfamily)
MNDPIDTTVPEGDFQDWLASMRPELHRYCSRMMGSAIDGEDAVQQALLHAIEARAGFGAVEQPRPWLYRIAHNASMDMLRRRRREGPFATEEEQASIPDAGTTPEQRQMARIALRCFMQLPPLQRSCVALMDVLGYSQQELCDITNSSLPAVKAALHRGRTRLQALAADGSAGPATPLSVSEQGLLSAYAEHFNARRFDAIRSLLAEEVRLDLVGRQRMQGKAEVGNYLHNYAGTTDWFISVGRVDGRAALIVSAPAQPAVPSYFILLEWAGGKLVDVRDFRYARYAMESAVIDASSPALRGS